MTQQTSGGSCFFRGTPKAAANTYRWENLTSVKTNYSYIFLTADNNFQAIKHIDVCFF